MAGRLVRVGPAAAGRKQPGLWRPPAFLDLVASLPPPPRAPSWTSAHCSACLEGLRGVLWREEGAGGPAGLWVFTPPSALLIRLSPQPGLSRSSRVLLFTGRRLITCLISGRVATALTGSSCADRLAT